MTAFTLSSGTTVLWDSFSGGSVNATLDSYTLSAGTILKIDTDSYQCANHSAAFGSLDTVNYLGIGGEVLIDATLVRVIAFSGGSGTVPAIGTSITQGGVSGPLLGVWADWQSEPLANAAAMPATGFIKIRSKSGGSFAAGALGGITATANGADVVGWIEVRGADTAAITVPRIGKFRTVGDWFELGLTTGVRGQILGCPTTATITGVFPGVWIETAAGSNVYEHYVGCGSMANLATTPTDVRGKIIWQTAAGIRIGSDGVNNVGFLPPVGCRVRVPNIFLTCCTRTVSGSGPRVLPSASLTTRQEFVTTSAGDIQLHNVVMNWYGNFSQAIKTSLKHSALSDTMVLQEVKEAIDVDNCIVGVTQIQINFALNMLTCLGGGIIKDTTFARASLSASGSYVNTANYNKGVTFLRVKSQTVLNRGNATTGTWTCTQNVDCVWEDITNIGGRMVLAGSQRSTVKNHHYADNFNGVTSSALPHNALDCSTGCVGTVMDGIDFLGLANVQPYGALLQLTACYQTKMRNIGSYAAPLDLAVSNGTGLVISSSGNNDDIKIQRVFTLNTRTGTWSFTNSDNNILLEQVKADYSDSSVIASLNTIAKGVSLLGTTTGQISVYGTHWKDSFTSLTVGKIEILCNESTTATAAQCVATGGTPRFNSSGQVALTAVGDEITWEMPYFAKGHTALANLASTNTGTNPGNLIYEFQYDKGVGYNGVWLVVNGANLTGAGAIDPAIGVKLKVRARCATANATNLLTNIAIPTVTTSAAQGATLYPLDVNTVTFTGLPTGCDAVVLSAGTSNILASQDQGVGTTYSYTYSGAQSVDVGFLKQGYVAFYIRNLSLTTNDNIIPVALTVDRNFA